MIILLAIAAGVAGLILGPALADIAYRLTR